MRAIPHVGLVEKGEEKLKPVTPLPLQQLDLDEERLVREALHELLALGADDGGQQQSDRLAVVKEVFEHAVVYRVRYQHGSFHPPQFVAVV